MWTIILIVLGLTCICGLGIYIYCKQKDSQQLEDEAYECDAYHIPKYSKEDNEDFYKRKRNS